eukprot:752393-Rhodomonas_salina.1
MQENTIWVQCVPGMRFIVFDFGVCHAGAGGGSESLVCCAGEGKGELEEEVGARGEEERRAESGERLAVSRDTKSDTEHGEPNQRISLLQELLKEGGVSDLEYDVATLAGDAVGVEDDVQVRGRHLRPKREGGG